jgi:hypothetical protein
MSRLLGSAAGADSNAANANARGSITGKVVGMLFFNFSRVSSIISLSKDGRRRRGARFLIEELQFFSSTPSS